ncbi:unnamed protein product [Paramecium octaurelia]|uniref:Uncharacterized protein n=1 Tax=Paramecium octaurelia TaxID=43137 RepID=A0A8S1T9U8_PAROT|nr:unnamed protein product [Paramecium octaurelia]
MKVDFLTRFKGRTSTMNKREGVTGIIKSNGTPIEKMPASYTFSSYISNQHAYNYSDVEKHSQQSNDVTPTSKDPQVITNIKTFNKNRKLSHASPLKPGTNMSNMYRSQFVPDKEMYSFPLSKTGSVNLNDYELIAIPKSVLQFGIRVEHTDGDQPRQAVLPNISRQFQSKSQSLDLQQDRPMIKSEILNQGSYAKQKEKRSLLIAGMNSIK